MLILSISDLHLGDGSWSDDFKFKDTKQVGFDHNLINWIDSLKPDLLILGGDIYELWQHSLKFIKKAHPLLWNVFECEILKPYKIIKLCGNHDYSVFGKLTHTIDVGNGRKIFFSHGFQNDKSMSNPFIRLGVWCLGLIEKIIPNIEVVEKVFKKSSVSSQISENTLKYAESLVGKYDLIVCGHTHNIGVHNIVNDKGNAVYYNSGTCQHGKMEGVLIDTETNMVKKVQKSSR